MSHRFYIPPPSLQADVKCFCMIEIEQELFNQRLFLADPYPGLVINLGAPLLLETEKGKQIELPRAFLLGVQAKPSNIQATGEFKCIGINLASWAGRFFVDKTVDLAVPFVPLDSDWQDFARVLKTVMAQCGEAEAVVLFEKTISDLHSQNQPDVAPVRAAIELMRKTNGQCNIDELAERCYLSRSQLERRFNYLTGVSPKTMCRLIRFQAICSNLAWNPMCHMTDLVYKFGYVDQAHFIHEFQALAGQTPRKFIDYRRRLAVDTDFLQFSGALADTCVDELTA